VCVCVCAIDNGSFTERKGTDEENDADENDRSGDPSHDDDYQIAQHDGTEKKSAETNTRQLQS